ncbi:MAG: biotin--[acetyl-CoA-carboxylase] ligase [Xanthobacteraceae bacterium]
MRRLQYEVLDSTNAEALRQARAGEPGPLWITAVSQTAGRGRRGRDWVSTAGNLHATLLLTRPSSMECFPQLSFVAALATHDAVREAALATQLTLKWPNDLLLAGAKVAGILLEAEGTAVAIGIGVNCASHPTAAEYHATDLRGTGISTHALLERLATTMSRRLRQWMKGRGFAKVRADWLERASGLGRPMRVRIPGAELSGRFESLDAAGGLILRLASGEVRTVTAGDVMLAPAPEAWAS